MSLFPFIDIIVQAAMAFIPLSTTTRITVANTHQAHDRSRKHRRLHPLAYWLARRRHHSDHPARRQPPPVICLCRSSRSNRNLQRQLYLASPVIANIHSQLKKKKPMGKITREIMSILFERSLYFFSHFRINRQHVGCCRFDECVLRSSGMGIRGRLSSVACRCN